MSVRTRLKRTFSISAACVGIVALTLLARADPARAQTCIINEQGKLTGNGGGGFGDSISVSGDVALFGAAKEDNGGAAYVLRFDGSDWVEEARLTPDEPVETNWWGGPFGSSVSISGDVAVIGFPGEDSVIADSGAAWVFRFNGTDWVEEAKLKASDAVYEHLFGGSVSIIGDVALIGSAQADGAYVFRFNGSEWVEEARLSDPDVTRNPRFRSVSLSGDVAFLGAEADGATYVFRFNGSGWILEARLTASDAVLGDYFGGSVVVRGDVALVAASDADELRFGAFAAYVFRFNGSDWIEEAKLTGSDSAYLSIGSQWGGDGFGQSVARHG